MAFPGQVEKIVLSLEQVERLTSRIRSDVFWAFVPGEPQSVAQVAKGLGKSAQTVHYHVKELLQVGLLLPAGTRQSRSRTEVLYVHAAVTTVDQGALASREHHEMRKRSFRFTAKTLVEETEKYYELLESDPETRRYRMFSRYNALLTVEQMAEIRKRLIDVMEQVVADKPAKGGARVHVMLYASPTQGQAREWLSGRDDEGEE